MGERAVLIAGMHGAVRIERDRSGVPQITAATLTDAQAGLGYCHARDRGLQMLLGRILGRGQASEKLQASEDSLALDRFFRRVNFGRGAAAQEALLSPPARAMAEAYSHGVRLYFQSARAPWELRLLGYDVRHDPWTTADIFLLMAALCGVFILVTLLLPVRTYPPRILLKKE